MSAEMFSALVTSRLRSVQGVEIEGGKGLQLHLRLNGKEMTAQLERTYERYLAFPDELDEVIDQYIQGLVKGETGGRAGNQSFADVRERIFPRLMTAQQWMSRRDEGVRLVVRSIAQDLGAALIVDEGDSFVYVQLDAIPAWEIDSQTAYEAAYENLAREFSEDHTTRNGERTETLLIDNSANSSAAILLPSRLRDWQDQIEGELVLGLPTHNLLLGFSRSHPAFEELKAQVAEDAESSHGLLGTLLLVRQGALELLTH